MHFDNAVDDLESNPITSVSMGTKMPPPPTPPTLPHAAPKNAIIVPPTILKPNLMSWKPNQKLLTRQEGENKKEFRENIKSVGFVFDPVGFFFYAAKQKIQVINRESDNIE